MDSFISYKLYICVRGVTSKDVRLLFLKLLYNALSYCLCVLLSLFCCPDLCVRVSVVRVWCVPLRLDRSVGYLSIPHVLQQDWQRGGRRGQTRMTEDSLSRLQTPVEAVIRLGIFVLQLYGVGTHYYFILLEDVLEDVGLLFLLLVSHSFLC